jgi:hypothetical protein
LAGSGGQIEEDSVQIASEWSDNCGRQSQPENHRGSHRAAQLIKVDAAGCPAEKSRDLAIPASRWLVARKKLSCSARRFSSGASRRPRWQPRLPRQARRDKLFACATAAPIQPTKLRASARAQRQIADLRQNARHLHTVQLGDERQQLCDKLIFYQFADFFLTVAFAA